MTDAASFVQLAGASMLLHPRWPCKAPTAFDMRHVLALNVPVVQRAVGR